YWGCRFADLLAAGRLGELRSEVSAYRRLQAASAASTALSLVRPFVPRPAADLLRGRVRGGADLVGPRLRGLPQNDARDGGPYPDRLRRMLHRILTRHGLPELLHYED